MSSFAVEFDPPLPIPSSTRAHVSLDGIIPCATYYDVAHQVRIMYSVNGMVFSYHPVDPLTGLGDLISELELVRCRHSHDITLAGYTVLIAEICESDILFYDPTDLAEDRVSVGGSVRADLIEHELQFAINTLWNKLESIQAEI